MVLSEGDDDFFVGDDESIDDFGGDSKVDVFDDDIDIIFCDENNVGVVGSDFDVSLLSEPKSLSSISSLSSSEDDDELISSSIQFISASPLSPSTIMPSISSISSTSSGYTMSATTGLEECIVINKGVLTRGDDDVMVGKI